MRPSLRPVVVAHGLEGSPEGAKVRALREAGLPVFAPDGRRKALAERIPGIRAALEAHPGAVLVGSSYGGLAALALVDQLAQEGAELPHALVLLAPALMWNEPPVSEASQLKVPESVPCVVFHGVADEIVPIEESRALVARCPHVVLQERPDGHRLSATLPEITAEVTRLAQRAPSVG